MYDKHLILDTSNATENLGDFIIMDAVRKQLRRMFPNDFFVYSTTHDSPGHKGFGWAEQATLQFIGGSNLLSGRFIGRNRAQWRFGFRDTLHMNKLIGVGLGWQSDAEYKSLINVPLVYAQKKLYKMGMSNNYIHSVRDSHTQKNLEKYGIKSINTACVTMWDLTAAHLSSIPKNKAKKVITTITNYRKSDEHMAAYRSMITTLLRLYDEVEMWIQTPGDLELLAELNIKGSEAIKFINPNLEDYDRALEENVDYVGTRLHAGIRALQHAKRTLIIEVDNRAREIAKDTNLPTLGYENIQSLEELLENELTMDVRVPFDQIELWKNQFKAEMVN